MGRKHTLTYFRSPPNQKSVTSTRSWLASEIATAPHIHPLEADNHWTLCKRNASKLLLLRSCSARHGGDHRDFVAVREGCVFALEGAHFFSVNVDV